MAEQLREVFRTKKSKGERALVSFVTCGFPSLDETVSILLGLEAGGTDIIELGVPFTDALADGPTICYANEVALANGVTLPMCLQVVEKARKLGLKAPIILMGYYNPLLMYGEERVVADAKAAGANGFIVVDLPPEEAIRFRGDCTKQGLSYVPLIAPSTSRKRIETLTDIADSFIYIVSRMGTTGASATGTMSASLPELCARVREFSSDKPIAVGFGVSTRDHFLSVGQLSDGVVIGSRIITVMKEAPEGQAAKAAEEYIAGITARDGSAEPNRDIGVVESIGTAKNEVKPTPSDVIKDSPSKGEFAAAVMDSQKLKTNGEGSVSKEQMKYLPPRFGEFGGQYVPESLMDCLAELEQAFISARNDPKFWEEFRSYYDYMGRPSRLDFASRLTEHCKGARIWLKREDLNHTGSHKINNAVGQVLLARRLGKQEVLAETGAGQHGVATATAAAKFGMKCTVYMGAEDVRRQALNVFRMKLLGARVVSVESGTKTLRDAVNEAMRAWVTNLSTTHYVIGSAIGPHPFPTLVRTFQSVIGDETKQQMQEKLGKLPDVVMACVGGGSNSTGMFYPFSKDPSVRMIGVEAGGEGIDTPRHSATLSAGSKGVFHGVRTYVLQDKEGQILSTHSVSAGLDYPGVGPELAMWKDMSRAEFVAATDAQAFLGFRNMSQLEGIIPALETSHAVWAAIELAKTMKPDQDIVICLSGRGDKDVQSVAEELPRLGPQIGWDLRF